MITLRYILSRRQPEREVLWYWEEAGNAGKSFLADWLEIHRDAFVVTGGKFADIAYAFNYQEVIVFDFARDQEERFPYKLLEDFKVRCVPLMVGPIGRTDASSRPSIKAL